MDVILDWTALRRRMVEAPRRYHMQTAYYDTREQFFSSRRITVRCRLENETPVVCVKAPIAGERDLHGEWELEGCDVAAALPALVAQGAPEALLEAGTLICLWKADFTRRAVLLRFDDGSACELALDAGMLLGPTQSQPFCELELELKAGEPAETLALRQALCERYGLQTQPKSKFARARALN